MLLDQSLSHAAAAGAEIEMETARPIGSYWGIRHEFRANNSRCYRQSASLVCCEPQAHVGAGWVLDQHCDRSCCSCPAAGGAGASVTGRSARDRRPRRSVCIARCSHDCAHRACNNLRSAHSICTAAAHEWHVGGAAAVSIGSSGWSYRLCDERLLSRRLGGTLGGVAVQHSVPVLTGASVRLHARGGASAETDLDDPGNCGPARHCYNTASDGHFLRHHAADSFATATILRTRILDWIFHQRHRSAALAAFHGT